MSNDPQHQADDASPHFGATPAVTPSSALSVDDLYDVYTDNYHSYYTYLKSLSPEKQLEELGDWNTLFFQGGPMNERAFKHLIGGDDQERRNFADKLIRHGNHADRTMAAPARDAEGDALSVDTLFERYEAAKTAEFRQTLMNRQQFGNYLDSLSADERTAYIKEVRLQHEEFVYPGYRWMSRVALNRGKPVDRLREK